MSGYNESHPLLHAIKRGATAEFKELVGHGYSRQEWDHAIDYAHATSSAEMARTVENFERLQRTHAKMMEEYNKGSLADRRAKLKKQHAALTSSRARTFDEAKAMTQLREIHSQLQAEAVESDGTSSEEEERIEFALDDEEELIDSELSFQDLKEKARKAGQNVKSLIPMWKKKLANAFEHKRALKPFLNPFEDALEAAEEAGADITQPGMSVLVISGKAWLFAPGSRPALVDKGEWSTLDGKKYTIAEEGSNKFAVTGPDGKEFGVGSLKTTVNLAKKVQVFVYDSFRVKKRRAEEAATAKKIDDVKDKVKKKANDVKDKAKGMFNKFKDKLKRSKDSAEALQIATTELQLLSTEAELEDHEKVDLATNICTHTAEHLSTVEKHEDHDTHLADFVEAAEEFNDPDSDMQHALDAVSIA